MEQKQLLAENIGLSHVAIIMDGNGRWASARGLARNAGHREGARALERVLRTFSSLGVRCLTLYAFSTENWRRPEDEVDGLMKLIEGAIVDRLLPRLRKKCGFTVRFIGDLSLLPTTLRARCAEAECLSTDAPMICNIALNYGGRAEIADAAKKIALKVQKGEISPEHIDEKLFAQNLYLPDVPDPDLLIRTSGELRLSNFLLWELSYSEIYVTDTYWPDFDLAELNKAIDAFQKRNRRYGGR